MFYIFQLVLYQLIKSYNHAVKNNADIVGCEWFLSFERNERHMKQANVVTGDELFVKMAHGVMRWNLWLFMVRRSMYELPEMRFIEGMNMGEDMMVMMKCYQIGYGQHLIGWKHIQMLTLLDFH